MKKMLSRLLVFLAMGWALASVADGGARRDFTRAFTNKPVYLKPRHASGDCFAGGSQFSLFAAGYYPENTAMEEGFGGGFGYGFFFNDYVGTEFSASWLDGGSVINAFDMSATLRYPIPNLSVAPYVTGGIGLHADSVNQFTTHIGGGLDLRLPNMFSCGGVFVDGRYVFGDETEDYTVVRAGIRTTF